jgi:hypothetical protein
MAERRDTLVCSFTKESPRLSALEIHEWIHSKLRPNEQDVTFLQIDGIRRKVFIKVRDVNIIDTLIENTQGQLKYEHAEGIVSTVHIMMSGLGRRRIRIANLPSELDRTYIKQTQEQYAK